MARQAVNAVSAPTSRRGAPKGRVVNARPIPVLSNDDDKLDQAAAEHLRKPIEDNERPIFSAEARKWHSAFIGKTGSGKTYAARGEVEIMLDEGQKVIIVDPTGAWHGLRMNPDGTPSGRNIIVFGGRHGDRVLTPDMAPVLGRIAGHENRSMILDLSGTHLEIEDQREIVYQFLKGLYQTSRTPLNLVIDEADEFAPQELDKDTKPLRTMVARIMARGRSLGFRCTLITQRPAKIDKNSISQVESMVCLRVTAPQDRKAIEDWFDDKGGQNRKEAIGGLGSLKTGEGWVFVASEDLYEHRRFRKISSYDSSQTPVNDQGEPIELDMGSIDLRDIDARITYPEENDEAELEQAIARRRNLEVDNKRLRARILNSEARYEAMRRFFVQIRHGIDEILSVQDVEGVEIADLLLLRNDVADDIQKEHISLDQTNNDMTQTQAVGLADTFVAPVINNEVFVSRGYEVSQSTVSEDIDPVVPLIDGMIHQAFHQKTMNLSTTALEEEILNIIGGNGPTLDEIISYASSAAGWARKAVKSLEDKGFIIVHGRGYVTTDLYAIADLDFVGAHILRLAATGKLSENLPNMSKAQHKLVRHLFACDLISLDFALTAKCRDAIEYAMTR